MKKYTTILFDLDGTLLDFKKSEEQAIIRVLKKHGLPHTQKEAEIYSKINLSFWEAFERGDIKREEIFVGRFKKLLSVLNEQADAEKIAADYFVFLADGHDLIDYAIEILKHLRAKGYKLYGATNGIVYTQKKRVVESGISEYTDGMFISETMGVKKPQKEYFDYIIERIDEKDRTKILIIGDSLTSDILGGKNAGIDTCWMNAEGKKADIAPDFEIKSLKELEKLL